LEDVALLTDDTGEANVCEGASSSSRVTKTVTALISEIGLIARMLKVKMKMMGYSSVEKGVEL
jgi:hypothetical protein